MPVPANLMRNCNDLPRPAIDVSKLDILRGSSAIASENSYFWRRRMSLELINVEPMAICTTER